MLKRLFLAALLEKKFCFLKDILLDAIFIVAMLGNTPQYHKQCCMVLLHLVSALKKFVARNVAWDFASCPRLYFAVDLLVNISLITVYSPWLAHLVRSLLSNHKVPSSIPAVCRDLNICVIFFSAWANSAFHPSGVGTVNEYQRLLGANLRWISVPSRESQGLSSALTAESGDKRQSHGSLGP